MILASIRDGNFTDRAFGMGFGGDNIKEKPRLVTWKKLDQGQATRFYTDVCLSEATMGRHMKVAWLIEPPGGYRSHYLNMRRIRQEFDFVLTWHDGEMLHRNSIFFPFGGSWIALRDWAVYEKSAMLSIIASGKRQSEGHMLRHDVISAHKNDGVGKFDIFGYSYNPIPRKITALAPYRYSVVIEPWRGNCFFTEKLIDCLACGTVPIYWGCPSIGNFFDARGIIQFGTLEELDEIMKIISEKDYQERLPYIEANLVKAKEFRCPDDWIVRHYPHLFDGLAKL